MKLKKKFEVKIEDEDDDLIFKEQTKIVLYNFKKYGVLPAFGDLIYDDDGQMFTVSGRDWHRNMTTIWVKKVVT